VQKLIQNKQLNRHIQGAMGQGFGPADIPIVSRRANDYNSKRNNSSSTLRWLTSYKPKHSPERGEAGILRYNSRDMPFR